MNEEDNFIEPPSQNDAPRVSLVAVPLAYSTLPIPEFKNNPQSAIDNKYNLPVANAIKQRTSHGTRRYGRFSQRGGVAYAAYNPRAHFP
nr:BPK_HP1_G0043680.mRNA.1.CDS.1 [Saccharomyces cerevisiae]